MSISEAKRVYDTLVENGELSIFFPNLSGKWSEDRNDFISQYNFVESMLDDPDDPDDFDDCLDCYEDF